MPDIINADYQIVMERTPETICVEIKTIEVQTCAFVIENAIKIGQRLTELKSMLGHGNWLEYCEKNLEYKEKQVQRFIKISNTYGDENSPFSNPSILSDLSISKAYSLLAVPEDEVESFAEEHNIHDMTVAQLEAEIKEWKSKADKTSASLAAEKEKNEELMEVIDEGEKRRLELVNEITELEERTANPEEIADLRKQLETEKAKAKKAQEALAAETASQQTKIEAAVESKSDELRKSAQQEQAAKLASLEAVKESAENKVKELEKKLEQSGSEEIAVFKVRSRALQQEFLEMKQAIQSMAFKDPEQAQKMKVALRKVMSELLEGLDV